MNQIKIGGHYRHYKGSEYVVLCVGKNSENPDEEFVIYQGQYIDPKFGKNSIWIRPKKMFLGQVEINGKKVPRFKLVK